MNKNSVIWNAFLDPCIVDEFSWWCFLINSLNKYEKQKIRGDEKQLHHQAATQSLFTIFEKKRKSLKMLSHGDDIDCVSGMCVCVGVCVAHSDFNLSDFNKTDSHWAKTHKRKRKTAMVLFYSAAVWLHEKKISHIKFIYIRLTFLGLCIYTVHAQSFHSHTEPNESRIVAIAFKWFWHHEHGKIDCEHGKCIPKNSLLTLSSARADQRNNHRR